MSDTVTMARPGALSPELAGEALLYALPAALALVGLVALGELALLPALAAWLLALLAAAALAWRQQARLGRATGYVDLLGGGERLEPPMHVVLGAGDLDAALRRLGRRLLERQARERAAGELWQRMLEALPDPVLLLAPDRTVRATNSAAAVLFEASPLGRPLEQVLRDPGLLAAVGDALAEGRASDLPLGLAGLVHRAFRVRVLPVRDAQGEIAALVSLRERTEELVIERMRSDFVAHASHELRTPLTTIRGFIETLRGPARDDEEARDRFLAIMAVEAERMTRLLNDLLSLSRIEQLEHSPPQQRIALGEVLAAVVRSLEPAALARNVRLLLRLPADLPPLRADPDQLHQVFANLVDNAIKYGGEGKTVTVAAERFAHAPPGAGPLAGRPGLAVGVADEGEGLPRDVLPRLTERFYRVDSARSRSLGGTGLGLAIVKHAVRRHRGHLAITSEIGKGSVFTVHLPID